MKFSTEELKEILVTHKKWLNDKPGGKRANFEEANLRLADLREANLRWVIGNRNEIKNILTYSAYDITYTSTHLIIGCEQHLIENWRDFTGEEIREMGGDKATNFWSRNKDEIFSIIERNPASDIKPATQGSTRGNEATQSSA